MARSASSLKIAVLGIEGAWSSERLADAVQAQTGYRKLLSPDQLVADFEHDSVRCGDLDLTELDAILVKKIASKYSPDALDRVALLTMLERRGVRICSPTKSMRALINRLEGSIALHQAKAPLPPTMVTESISAGLEMIKRHGAVICKPFYTSKARGMEMIKDGPQADRELMAFKEAGNPMMYIQALVNAPGRDLGVSFLGGEYLGTYARVRGAGDDGWRTTTNSGGHYEGHSLSPELIELARRAQEPFGLDFTCVDVVETADGPRIYEVSAFGGFRGLLEGCEIDAAKAYVEYVVKGLCA